MQRSVTRHHRSILPTICYLLRSEHLLTVLSSTHPRLSSTSTQNFDSGHKEQTTTSRAIHHIQGVYIQATSRPLFAKPLRFLHTASFGGFGSQHGVAAGPLLHQHPCAQHPSFPCSFRERMFRWRTSWVVGPQLSGIGRLVNMRLLPSCDRSSFLIWH